ncbi:hypothetical protein SAMN04488109_1589 [Chryseolinea serpens]|uniref:Uncharacterized protein n=1 Tax=Chryseolinea serpens TaxID=947013 RepID=A0A1M5M7U9_9BACT|nr:hypothetical protein [Chryseolinea serpens]SHG73019.1 hypothetical protein SAMN04488109_1589 [Chryseolinea serpens]
MNLNPAKLLLIILLIAPPVFGLRAQSNPDSIVVQHNTYYVNWPSETSLAPIDCLYQTNYYRLIRKNDTYEVNGKDLSLSTVKRLVRGIEQATPRGFSIADYGIDTTWIKLHPAEILERYSNKRQIIWNPQQKAFMKKELARIANYKKFFRSLVEAGCCYGIHRNYRDEYRVQLYKSGIRSSEIISRKRNSGFYMPWITMTGDTLADFSIEENLADIIPIKTVTKPLRNKQLLKYLAKKTIDYYMPTLYQLSAYTYEAEIRELESDFKIESFEEVYGRGRYIGNEPTTIKVVLKNDLMYDNVRLNFMAIKQTHSLYSRDSVKKDYKEIVTRVQGIDFILKFLKDHPKAVLDIYYFNNRAINDYNIENVNKTPETWARHDKYVKSLEWSKERNIPLSFDVEEAIRVSRQNDCGCNYRFAENFIKKAIFFEIIDGNKNSSVWFLLPDNTVLLYLMQGTKVLDFDYTEFGESRLQYPCALFNTIGQRLVK